MKLLFISESIDDLPTIQKCLMDDVLVFRYHPLTDSISKLEKFMKSELIQSNRFSNVGWIFHSPSDLRDVSSEISIFKDVHLSRKTKKRSMKKLVAFFKLVEKTLSESATVSPRFDLLACCLLKNPVFLLIREHLFEELSQEHSQLQIAASDDLTGSMHHAAQNGELSQDWILESHNLNLIGLYFTPQIESYMFHFKNDIIASVQENVSNAAYAAVDGNWEGVVNSLGSAVLMVPTTLPIVDGIKRTYEVLQDPGIQAIFDCIPGLNVVSYTVRMTQFIEKAARGEINDWDIALCVLDSVSLAAGFAAPGGNAGAAAVRTTTNIGKVKNLAKSSLSVLQYSKDIGEITQNLVENPSEASISSVALSVAKIAVSSRIGKAKMKDQVKIALESGNAASFYAIAEVSKRAEEAYDSQAQALALERAVVLFEHSDFNGASFQFKRGTTSVCFDNFQRKCSSLKVPPRTAVRLWEGTNYQGESQDYCNWNWFDMNISWVSSANNDRFSSGVCVKIREDGSIGWEI